MRQVELLFDTIRSPYDMAHIVQIAESINAIVYTSGKNSLSFDISKVATKVKSWNIKDGFKAIRYDSFEEAVKDLHSKGKYLIGTSGNTDKIFYNVELPKDQDIVIVFGTETSGLTLEKQKMLDELVKLPMNKQKVDFLTLPVAVSAMAYELYRQFMVD
ncbi:MAG TPA: TrmH family RNA methyltransferase [bacterium]|nr:TrmH family RNA methyltransferase [bacterium]